MTVTIEGPHFTLRGSGALTVSLSPVSDFGGGGVYLTLGVLARVSHGAARPQ